MSINPTTHTGSLPFKIANTYGVSAPQRIAPVQPANAPAKVGGDTEANASRITQLVAGVVPGRVDFSGDVPTHDGSLSLYSHPADANAAATGVTLGRVLDLEG
ncbi:MAG: hypothetical protein AAGB51_03070 [Planctomycetota bacterium]